MRIRSFIILAAAMSLISALPSAGWEEPDPHSPEATISFPLPDLIHPDSITVQNNKVYITDGESVYIFKRHNLQLQKKFGKRGEGPGEFRFAPGSTAKLGLYLTSDRIMINSMNRVTFFTLAGDYLNEKNIPSGNRFIPVGDNYVGYASTRDDQILYLRINLYDGEFKKIRSILRQEYYVQTNKPFNLVKLGLGGRGRIVYEVCENKIYVAGDQDTIHVFNPSGEKEHDIRPAFEKIKITPGHIQTIREDLDTLYTSQFMRKLIREKGFFPEYFPARPFRIADRMIHMPTHRKRNGQTEFILMNLEGEVKKNAFVDFKEKTLLMPYPYTIHEGTLYQLVEEEESEAWQLLIHSIDYKPDVALRKHFTR